LQIFFSTKLIFFLGQARSLLTGEGTALPQTPPLHSSQYLSPTFNLTPTPLGPAALCKLGMEWVCQVGGKD